MKRLIKFLYIALSLYCIMQSIYRFAFNWDMFHSFGDVSAFVLCFMDETTVYSVQYSEDAFMSVEIGMSKSDVKELLGQPIRKQTFDKNGSQIWRYTHTYVPDGFYWARRIEFNDEGLVVSKMHDYWDD